MKKIIHYNSHSIGDIIYHIFGNNTPEHVTNLNHLIEVFKISLIDRTETIRPYFDIKITDRIPSFEDVGHINYVGLSRADEIIRKAKAESKKIRLMWSGGLDSTTAFFWFLASGHDLKDIFEVGLNQHSIDEYPQCYEYIKQNNIPTVTVSKYLLDIPEDTLIVTGEHGDQLFGSTLFKRFNIKVPIYGYHEYKYTHDIRAMTLPAYPLFGNIFIECSGDITGGERIEKYLQPLMEKCPFKLKTVYDISWWLNFTMKWQDVQYRMTTSCPTKEHNHIPFFSSVDFQRWAMTEKNHLENKIVWDSSNPWSTYKKALREVIQHYTGDVYYSNNKPKVDSIMHHNLNGMCLRYDDGSIDTFKDVVTNIDYYRETLFNV